MFELPSFVSSQPRGEQHGGVVRSRDLHTPVSQAEPALLNDFIVLDLVGRFFATRFLPNRVDLLIERVLSLAIFA